MDITGTTTDYITRIAAPRLQTRLGGYGPFDGGHQTPEARRCAATISTLFAQYVATSDAEDEARRTARAEGDSRRPWVKDTTTKSGVAIQAKAQRMSMWAAYTQAVREYADEIAYMAERARSKPVTDEQLSKIGALYRLVALDRRGSVTELRMIDALDATEGNLPARAELSSALAAAHVNRDAAEFICGISGFNPEKRADALRRHLEVTEQNEASGFCPENLAFEAADAMEVVARWA